jgi:uncharacterized caspase-like protein
MRAWAVTISLLAAIMTSGAAQAERRVALVIGNGAYTKMPALPNPRSDAEAMASLLKQNGFEVIEGVDLTAAQLAERVRQFGATTDGADIALFYYSGQGLAVNGTPYLLAVDASIKSEADLKMGGSIEFDSILADAMKGAHVRLAFLDASRDNPFRSSVRGERRLSVGGGLAEMQTPQGSLVGFACSPNQTAKDGPKGGHSPFTKALLEHIAAPGVEIQQAMTEVRAAVREETKGRQLPWGHTNLVGTIYLNPAGAERK